MNSFEKSLKNYNNIVDLLLQIMLYDMIKNNLGTTDVTSQCTTRSTIEESRVSLILLHVMNIFICVLQNIIPTNRMTSRNVKLYVVIK